MTKIGMGQTKKTVSISRRKSLVFCYMGIFMLILFFKNSDAAATWVIGGLRICATRLIPALFPFMVASSIIVSSGAGAYICKPFGRISQSLMGIGADGICAVTLGWLCGFPVGAKCAAELYDGGRIGDEEYNRVICVSGIPSPAFLIGAVGKGMMNSESSGVLLYAATLVSSVIIGIILHRFCKSSDENPCKRDAEKIEKGFPQVLTGAITESSMGIISVCAFVVFFSAFLGVMDGAMSVFCISEEIRAGIFCVFELTSGISKISILNTSLMLPLAALAVGWSGLSVHFQIISVCSGRGMRQIRYFLCCVLRAVLCLILVFVAELLGNIFSL